MTSIRASGILLHPTSLPGRFGIGDLGSEAYAFADFLVAGGQSLWQMLPLGPTGYGDSPYACYSAFAGNTLLISPEVLREQELVSDADLEQAILVSARVDYGHAYETKTQLLLTAYANFQRGSDDSVQRAFAEFVEANRFWLDDYSLFRALKTANGNRPWHEWDAPLRLRDSSALQRARESLREEIAAHNFFQFIFFQQWFRLKRYCKDRGLRIIGDIPIFVALDSADVWTQPKQFKLDAEGRPTVVAGVPPDYFSATGQLWGNPLYDWDRMEADGFRWWIQRVRAALEMVDVVRIDHFRGFAACWEIPAGDETAERGRWVNVPGKKLFGAIRKELGELPIIAEDLGVITPDVEELRDEVGLPGMRVLQFAFGGDATSVNLPHNYVRNVAVYTGTHDNDTTVGWFQTDVRSESTQPADDIEAEREYCRNYLSTTGDEIHWDFIRAVLASVADTAIVPLQDVLGAGNEARMNLPNTTNGNWDWRFAAGELTDAHAQRLRNLTQIYGRLPRGN